MRISKIVYVTSAILAVLGGLFATWWWALVGLSSAVITASWITVGVLAGVSFVAGAVYDLGRDS